MTMLRWRPLWSPVAGAGLCRRRPGGAHRCSKRGSYDAGTPQDIAKPGYGINANFDAALSLWLIQAGDCRRKWACGRGWLAWPALLTFVLRCQALSSYRSWQTQPTAEYGLSWMLPRIVGLGRANDLLLTSRVFFPEEAERIGFINQLFLLKNC